VLLLILAGMAATTTAALAQTRPDPPSQILDMYRAQRTNWFTNVYPAANTLFALLALIDFAWSAAVMVLENQDFHSWVSNVVRKMMIIGAFYALLIYGRFWIPAIVDSFEILGQHASASGPLAPGDIFTRGLNLAGALIDGATSAGLFSNFGGALALVFAAAMCLLAFCAVTIQFVVAMVESYILVAAGFVFLGFGGSRWSSPYVERYIGLAIAIGVKIMLLYLLIGSGLSLSTQWLTDAEHISTSANPATDAFSIMGASLIFTALCWQAPKLVAGVLGGSPSLTGGDLVSTVGMITTGAAVLGSGAVAVGGWAAGAARGAMSVAEAVGFGSRAAATGLRGPGGAATSVALASGSSHGSDRASRNVSTNQPLPPVNRPSSNSNDTRTSAAHVVPPEYANSVRNRFERRL
jgi:type IV secretion system protein TrbL